MNYFSTRTPKLMVQHPCQVSFKSIQGCRRSWEYKLKCVKILSVKGHNSAKICRTWIISPHALLDLWCNIPAKFKSMQGCRRSWEDKLKCVKNSKCQGHVLQTCFVYLYWQYIYIIVILLTVGDHKYYRGSSQVSSLLVICNGFEGVLYERSPTQTPILPVHLIILHDTFLDLTLAPIAIWSKKIKKGLTKILGFLSVMYP